MRFSSDSFDYDPATKCFTAEISDLAAVCNTFVFHWVYDDAMDLGLSIVSSRTGAEIIYAAEVDIDDEGDVMQWTLYPTPESIQQHPSCLGTTVVVYND